MENEKIIHVYSIRKSNLLKNVFVILINYEKVLRELDFNNSKSFLTTCLDINTLSEYYNDELDKLIMNYEQTKQSYEYTTEIDYNPQEMLSKIRDIINYISKWFDDNVVQNSKLEEKLKNINNNINENIFNNFKKYKDRFNSSLSSKIIETITN